eukprot:5679126-Prymnesium_polylepis.1
MCPVAWATRRFRIPSSARQTEARSRSRHDWHACGEPYAVTHIPEADHASSDVAHHSRASSESSNDGGGVATAARSATSFGMPRFGGMNA